MAYFEDTMAGRRRFKGPGPQGSGDAPTQRTALNGLLRALLNQRPGAGSAPAAPSTRPAVRQPAGVSNQGPRWQEETRTLVVGPRPAGRAHAAEPA